MAGVGFPAANVLVALVIALEVGGGLLLIIGWHARWVATAFCGFTLLATMVFHAFWNSDQASVLNQLNNFMKNLAIIGGNVTWWPMARGRSALTGCAGMQTAAEKRNK